MIEESRNIATQWRQANQEHMGGVVLLWQGAAYGWKNELRDPQHEQPGAVAVDETGCVFVAEGVTNTMVRDAGSQPRPTILSRLPG